MRWMIALVLVAGLGGVTGCDSKKTDGKTDVKQPDGNVAEPPEEPPPPPVT
ncbi:MAG: hypothetical protein JNL82_00445 [Myxococcales bacterium]|nr:hypothetical protein [Myxococcales bacterium]